MTVFYPETDIQLHYAIEHTSTEHLQRIITRLCATIPEAKSLIASELLVPEDKVPVFTSDDDISIKGDGSEDEDEGEDSYDDEESGTESQISGASTKRKREESTASTADFDNPQKRFKPRYANCINCEEEYDVAENTNKSCRYHEEPRGEPDYDDFFADEFQEDLIDTDEYRKDYPEGYIHECCGRNTLKPCRMGFHRSK
ncbi:hypothetical protein BO82DRAFT_393276 [Aspergillus uvarum CBS 121591]|uniref:C2H2-type domain-containing protein n=1 Tax=Aspergillus uvarum CBS 121591 TaxID=1448315 RepID=A0A319C854_9EURO|nr:hypothetical protein BO82DRAFT_393276 [Aspergillus uvarum CBS 121591]PYH80141.1 hypothetical protein BO82DRAFT_393276 [Aspergillus uvarum CBS 121591]